MNGETVVRTGSWQPSSPVNGLAARLSRQTPAPTAFPPSPDAFPLSPLRRHAPISALWFRIAAACAAASRRGGAAPGRRAVMVLLIVFAAVAALPMVAVPQEDECELWCTPPVFH